MKTWVLLIVPVSSCRTRTSYSFPKQQCIVEIIGLLFARLVISVEGLHINRLSQIFQGLYGLNFQLNQYQTTFFQDANEILRVTK